MCMTLGLCTAVGRGKSTGLESDMVRELAKILKSKLLTDRIAAGTTHTDTSLLDVSSCICLLSNIWFIRNCTARMFNRFNNAKHTRWMMSQICIEQVHRSGQRRLPTSLVASLDAVPVMCCVPPHEIEKGRDPNPACTAGCTHTHTLDTDFPRKICSDPSQKITVPGFIDMSLTNLLKPQNHQTILCKLQC